MTPAEMYEKLEQTIREYNPAADFAKIREAFEFAAGAHGTQLRKDGSPFITHPLNVAQIIAEELHLDSESIEAALLHDTIEDTGVTHEDVARLFSPTVADLVEGVSKLTRVQYTSKAEEQMENLRKMLMAMSKDIRVILIKIADRLHNMRTMEYQTPEKQKQKSYETMEIYAPIAHRLGMQKMKWELEDLSLKYLDPAGYGEIIEALEEKANEYEGFMATIHGQISARLQETGLGDATVYGRMKHPYSIYRKMYTKDKSLDDVFDLFAFRVIVDTVADCYNVLGIIHDLYRPILGRFKDYIGTPKPNLYQSLHTTVMGDSGIPFEVQIRTHDMHAVAEYGIAAHWKYKLNGIGSNEERYEWVRRLLENQEGADAEDFIHSLKVDMFADEVFVFTPGGDVINLPAGATPIDFAYTIHSAVGNHMVSAKVNGRIVQLTTQLRNGDVVEVITSKTAHGPSRDWLKIAKSSNARSKIRQWFKREKRDENIVNGRASFEAEVKRTGVSLKELTNEENLPLILKKLCYNSLDDMYAAIGYGGVTALKLVGRLREDIRRITEQHLAERQAEEPVVGQPEVMRPVVPTRSSEHGIIVEGLSNCLVKFAKCCTPVPGDEIVGFITRGYGVSVHRCDCPNAAPERRRPEEKGRWIKVSWADKLTERYRTTVQIVSKDRNDLLVDISAILSSTKTQVLSLNAQATPDGFGLISMDIQVNGSDQLQTVIRRIETISGVMKVTRPAG